jgi:transcriptional regulator with XRE-family HTH domain
MFSFRDYSMARAETYHKADKSLLRQVGGKVRSLRTEAQLTIEELADRAKINPKYLQRCEIGQENFSISVLYSLAKALRISLSDFFQNIQ